MANYFTCLSLVLPLPEQAQQMAQANAVDLVERFGEMGRRKFNLAA